MSESLFPQIVKMFGIELEEEFKLDIAQDNEIFRISEKGFETRYVGGYAEELCPNWRLINHSLPALLTGKAKIVKLPFKPKHGKKYWTFYRLTSSNKWTVANLTWTDCVSDRAKFKVGWCYRTEKEAKTALPKIAKEQGVEYEL